MMTLTGGGVLTLERKHNISNFMHGTKLSSFVVVVVVVFVGGGSLPY